MYRKGTLLTNLGDMEKGTLVEILPKQTKLFGQTLGSLFKSTKDTVIVKKASSETGEIVIYSCNAIDVSTEEVSNNE